MRLEALGPRGVITGLEELERLLKDAIKATFEAREKAYDAEVGVKRSGRAYHLMRAGERQVRGKES